jgi:hypothetical protein
MKSILALLLFFAGLQASEFVGFTKAQEQQANAWILHAQRCASEYARTSGRSISHSSLPRGLVLYRSTRDLAKALGMPERVRGGRVVARCNTATGVIYLSKPYLDEATVFYECGRWFFGDNTGMQTGSAGMEKFARFCKDRAKAVKNAAYAGANTASRSAKL